MTESNLSAVPNLDDGETTEQVEVEGTQQRQLRFDGIPVKEHNISITGTIPVNGSEIRDMKAGKPVKLVVSGQVVSRKHSYRTNRDTGAKEIGHQVTVQVNWAEPYEDESEA